jgi:hypothetical protein
MAQPSVVKVIAGWVCAGVAVPFVLLYLHPGMAGLAALYLLTGALMILAAPVAHILLARSAVKAGSYSAALTVAKVAGGVVAVVLILALLGLFNFA